MHRLRLLHRAAAAAAAAVPLLATPAAAAPPEVRGTWMTTTANDALATPGNTAEAMERLRAIGLNTVYVEVWKNGYTQFPSETMEAAIGVARRPDLMPGHANHPGDAPGLDGPRDLLEETLIAAHRNQLLYIGWFEYGFMAAFKDTMNDLREQHPGWMTTTADGSLVSDQNPFVWMNPLRPECRDLLMGIVLDAVDRYDLDGVQLDDRIAWPVTMGYDDYTVAAYKEEHGGKAPPADARDPAWVAWRAEKVGEFAERFHEELKAKRPNLIVSISPAVYPWSLENYACDWRDWSRRGLMDEYVPQVYRTTFKRVSEDWPVQLRAVGSRRTDDLIGGFRINGDGPDTPWAEYEKKLDLVRRRGGGGHVHWFSRGVLETYPAELTAYYDVENAGHAASPMLPADWRPAPVVAERSGGAWHADVAEAGDFRVIARRGDVWSVVDTARLGAGTHELDAPADAEAVELLVDRRRAPRRP
ncbi:glycoside hydrolase family 10 protein [Phycisphaera mikurensis]|uniref:Glycosyl hydrolase-like 10 domain-containing protein n=1 Tax=Phycisphaera mikurensis (strain NBRC 102666 / KCTC 22515 / FYK2301M01) TaxID=1142394 RepID=I0IDW2_PHYMF|nr:family 10 glycosylhydrolase [Phycisphaera mikurensis]MBB6441257.1 uncharacterized lipoprotein YddW (UPF0748 family) [Phycisphaera mikurensis]BAM03450.1 hypothetical protein PSMK_12910 [Phycisphaera mikurensis NBRC 102666]